MRRIWVVTVALLAATAFAGTHAGSSARDWPRQDQSNAQKDEEKKKEDAGAKVTGPLGSKTNPVRCELPRGERQYLSRLRCPDGKRPMFSRIGSFGVGPYGNILDGYRVKCDGSDEVTVFMDMYHEGYVEKEAVPGFTIVNSGTEGPEA